MPASWWARARQPLRELTRAPEFAATAGWAGLEVAGFDGLLLPGGHAPGMRQYLGSAVLRDQAARFWSLGRPAGAICHGVLVLARTHDPAAQFQRGPITLRSRGTATSDTPAFVVQDRNYLSARWPGDAYLFARRFWPATASADISRPTCVLAGVLSRFRRTSRVICEQKRPV